MKTINEYLASLCVPYDYLAGFHKAVFGIVGDCISCDCFKGESIIGIMADENSDDLYPGIAGYWELQLKLSNGMYIYAFQAEGALLRPQYDILILRQWYPDISIPAHFNEANDPYGYRFAGLFPKNPNIWYPAHAGESI